jgi:hypothetical protein
MHEHFTELHYSFAEDVIFLCTVLSVFGQKSFSAFKQEHVFQTSEKHSSFFPAAGTRHFSVPHRLVVVSSQLIFQKTNQVKM